MQFGMLDDKCLYMCKTVSVNSDNMSYICICFFAIGANVSCSTVLRSVAWRDVLTIYLDS